MKALRIVGIIALMVVVIGMAAIVSQPGTVHVERSILIEASPEEIARETESFQSFSAWSPWNKSGQEEHFTIVTFEGFSTFCSEIKLEPQEDGTKVTWIYDGQNNSLKEKATWILMKGDLSDQYEAGLSALKEIVERKAAATPVPSDSLNTQ